MARLDVSLSTFQAIDTTSIADPPAEKSFAQGAPSSVGWTLVQRNDTLATANSAGNTITPTSTLLPIPALNSQIAFTYVGTSGLIQYTQTYFVINPTATNFQVSLTQGGAAVVIAVSSAVAYTTLFNPVGPAGATHTIWMQPQRSGEQWRVDRVTIQTQVTDSSGRLLTFGAGILVPQVAIYKGIVSQSALIDQTQNGFQDTDDLSSPLYLSPSEPIVVQFTNVNVIRYPGSVRCTVWLGGITNR